MKPFNVNQKVLCIEGFAILKNGDQYTIKESFDVGIGYTYELKEIPNEYWAQFRFVPMGDNA